MKENGIWNPLLSELKAFNMKSLYQLMKKHPQHVVCSIFQSNLFLWSFLSFRCCGWFCCSISLPSWFSFTLRCIEIAWCLLCLYFLHLWASHLCTSQLTFIEPLISNIFITCCKNLIYTHIQSLSMFLSFTFYLHLF